jgi:TPR repeat protein
MSPPPAMQPAPAMSPPPAQQPETASGAAEVVVALGTEPGAAAEPPPAAALAAVEVPRPVPVAAPAKPALRREEIAMMIERGRVLFEAGDLAAARLFFRRAANAGEPTAALAMAATYDPEVLTQHFIRGIEADAGEAQKWYAKAREMGQRVEMAQGSH